jgi:hypothetical protein
MATFCEAGARRPTLMRGAIRDGVVVGQLTTAVVRFG